MVYVQTCQNRWDQEKCDTEETLCLFVEHWNNVWKHWMKRSLIFDLAMFK